MQQIIWKVKELNRKPENRQLLSGCEFHQIIAPPSLSYDSRIRTEQNKIENKSRNIFHKSQLVQVRGFS